MGNERQIDLGRDPQSNEAAHTYAVVPQRHAYLQRQLSQTFESLGELDVKQLRGDAEGAILGQTTTQVWSLLKVFIPDLMPLYEWEGFSSDEAMKANDYDKERDRSPDLDQQVEAFKAVLEVNRLDLLRYIKDLVGPDFFKAQLQQRLGTLLADLLDPSSTPSPSLPQRNGGSAPTSSGTIGPTEAAASAASPSPASKPS
jgi:hypothetical protein